MSAVVTPLPRTITEAEFGRTFEEAAHLYGAAGQTEEAS